jgi:tetratricopeptide (TPR) repeat protein
VLATLNIKPTGDMAPLAKSAAERALAINAANSEAHSVLACMAAISDYDWKLAERHYRQAMAVEPVPAWVRYRYGLFYLLPLGRVAEAREQSRLALEADPLSMVLHLGMAWSVYYAKHYRETIEYALRAMEIDSFYLMWWVMGRAQLAVGLAQEAITSLKRAVDLAPWYHPCAWSLAAAYHKAGDHERSQELAGKLAESHGHTVGAAVYYATAGEVNAMFEALDRAYRQRDRLLIDIQNVPVFDPYRADARFQALLQRMNLIQ